MSSTDDVGDPSDWTGDAQWVAGLDLSLRCELCYDVFTAPVSLRACGHAFCSACIRTHINQPQAKGQFCPKCRQPKAYDSELVLQPALEVAAHVWRANRPRLRDTIDRQTRDAATIAHLRQRVAKLEKRVEDQEAHLYAAGATPSDEPHDDSPQERETHDLTHLPDPPDEVQEELFDRSSDPVEGVEPGLRFPPSSQRELAVLRERKTPNKILPLPPIPPRDDPPPRTGKRARSISSSSSDGFEILQMSPPLPPSKAPKSQSATPADGGLKAQSRVECPICGFDFTLQALNQHLDSGMCEPGRKPTRKERGLPTFSPPPSGPSSSRANGPTNTTITPAMRPVRRAPIVASGSNVMSYFTGQPTIDPAQDPQAKRIIRPHYHGLKEKDLRQLLKDASLNNTGSRERLVERHTQWINLWNANVDASPDLRRTCAQLRASLRDWETKVLDRPIRGSRNGLTTSALAPTHTPHAWIREHREQFRDLVRTARESAKRDREIAAAPASNEVEAEGP